MTQAPAHPILAAYQALAKDVRALDRLQREIGFEIARKSQANPNGLKAIQAMIDDAGRIARSLATRLTPEGAR